MLSFRDRIVFVLVLFAIFTAAYAIADRVATRPTNTVATYKAEEVQFLTPNKLKGLCGYIIHIDGRRFLCIGDAPLVELKSLPAEESKL